MSPMDLVNCSSTRYVAFGRGENQSHWTIRMCFFDKLVPKTYATKYESGCRLKSLDSIKRPLGFGLGVGREKLACEMALGLKARSVGPAKEYLDGRS